MNLASLRRAIGAGAWAVTDQALFAGANFTLNVLLARWLGDSGYGVFAVAYAVFLFVSLTFTALIIDPLLIYGAGRWRRSFSLYLRRVLVGLGALSLVGATLLLVASRLAFLLDGTGALRPVLVTLAWAGPIILLQWTLRRSLYAVGKPQLAAAGGAIYFAMLMTATLLAKELWGITAERAMAAMALASLIAAAFLWKMIAAEKGSAPPPGQEPATRRVFSGHWQYGRWILAGYVLDWLGSDVLYLVLAPAHGPEAVGAFRAAMTLTLPAMHTLVALSSVAVPWFVSKAGTGAFRRAITAYWVGTTALAAGYCLLLVAFAETIVRLVYGEVFSGLAQIVRTVAFIPLAVATQATMGTALRAIERTRGLFYGAAATAALTATVGIWLATQHGAPGAARAALFAAVLNAVALTWMARRAIGVDAKPIADRAQVDA